MKSLLDALNTILLVAILATLLVIWRRMPPTIGELRNAKLEKDQQAILLRKPIIDAAIDEPLRVEISPR